MFLADKAKPQGILRAAFPIKPCFAIAPIGRVGENSPALLVIGKISKLFGN